MANIPSPAPRELILVVKPEAKLRVRGDKLISIEEAKAADVTPLMDLVSAGHIVVRPLFGVSEEWLQHRTAHLNNVNMGNGQPLDLSIFYKVTCAHDELESLADHLRKLAVVQAAYVKPSAQLPFIDRGAQYAEGPQPDFLSGDFAKFQEYLDAAKVGINARYAWTKEGGRGSGVKIIDVEGSWRFSHEDLLENPSGCVGGVPVSDPKWIRHGTAVLGMLGGDHNDFGILGICPEAYVKTVSIFGNSDGAPSPDWGSAAAIRLAADMLAPGDILLLELHRPGPAANFVEDESTQAGYIPVEWWPCDMAAILYAKSRGVVVVEAAGNGRQSLDAPVYSVNPQTASGPLFPSSWRNPFERDPIDTGAILVGAGAPPENIHDTGSTAPDRSRWILSNHGRAVDAQGWGLEVATCGGAGELTSSAEEDRRYTRAFNGTSSAAAMVAGTLGCLQGVLRAKGAALDPASARALLQDATLNSPQQGSTLGPASAEPIGPRPDLLKLIDHLI